MNSNEKISHQWNILSHISQYIQVADSKAGTCMGIAGIVFGLLLAEVFSANMSTGQGKLVDSLTGIESFLLFTATIVLFTSVIFSFLCLIGRTGNTKTLKKILEPNVSRPIATNIFFGAIANYSSEEYQKDVTSTNETENLNDLIEQTRILSIIIREKYRWLTRAFVSLCLSLSLYMFLGILIAI